jgi:hypothetical protein
VTQGRISPVQGEHLGNGVWKFVFDSSTLDAARSDYYYIEYSIDSGETWVPVSGQDPTYFATKLITSYDYMPASIAAKYINLPATTGTIDVYSANVKVTLPSTYSGGDVISDGHIRQLYYKWAAAGITTIADLTEYQSGYGNIFTIPRVGSDTYSAQTLSIVCRLYNPYTGEYSMYNNNGTVTHLKMTTTSIEELLAEGLIPDPIPAMEEGWVTEESQLAANDSIGITIIPKGKLQTEVAYQWGGSPAISGDGELESFTGNIVVSQSGSIKIPKSMLLSATDTLYLAYRYTAFSESTLWMGDTPTTMLAITGLTPYNALSILSSSMLSGVTDFVLSAGMTGSGEGLTRRT